MSYIKAARETVAREPNSPVLQKRRDITGTVKWFNATKGFGFVAPDTHSQLTGVEQAVEGDIFLHKATLYRSTGLSKIAADQAATCHIQATHKGWTATSVRISDTLLHEPKPHILPPPASVESYLATLEKRIGRSLNDVPQSDVLQGTLAVKWFSRTGGFGFLKSPEGDVFIHMDTVRWAKLATLTCGDQLDVAYCKGHQGYVAVLVTGSEPLVPAPRRAAPTYGQPGGMN